MIQWGLAHSLHRCYRQVKVVPCENNGAIVTVVYGPYSRQLICYVKHGVYTYIAVVKP